MDHLSFSGCAVLHSLSHFNLTITFYAVDAYAVFIKRHQECLRNQEHSSGPAGE